MKVRLSTLLAVAALSLTGAVASAPPASASELTLKGALGYPN